MPERIVTQVGDRRITVSHLDKPLWPAFSKAQVLDYYLRVAPVLLPQVRRRPVSFLRCPAGADGPRFFTHTAPDGLPGWVATVHKAGRDHVALDDLETLIAVVNHYCLEIHAPQWNAETGPELHDRIVFDLDPGEGADVATCAGVALLLREELQSDHRGRVTSVRGPKARAGGKVLLDWAQNHGRATTAAPYTLRVHEGAESPSVATPLDWAEVEGAEPGMFAFTPGEVVERIETRGDLVRALADPAPF
jgi:bifunctional non-homologous end joining protein LigD